MKIFKLSMYLLSLLILLSSSHVLASGDHQGTKHASGISFRVDNYLLNLKIAPASFTVGQTPEVILSLNQITSSSPALDAEVYIIIEEKKEPAIGSMTIESKQDSAPKSTVPATSSDLDFDMFSAEVKGVDLATYTKLSQSQRAGTFRAKYPLPVTGDYSFTIAIKSLEGKSFAEPILYGSTFSYKLPSKSRQYRMIFIFVIVLLSSLGFLWLMKTRQDLKLQPGAPLNLLDINCIKKFLRSRWWQPVFQIPAFIVFLIVIIIGINDVQMGDKNIATMLSWTIWWAGVIFTIVLLGRVWCMMCPFGAAQDIVGRRISLNKTFPSPLRNIWLSTILFLALTWWDSYSGIVNRPALTAYLFIGFFVVTVTTALVYKGRTFCRYICPIGGLIGLYSMFSPLELRNKGLAVCRGDKAKGCIRGTDRTHPCPMFETPMTLDRNNYCNLCGECVKSCAEDNIVIRFRSFAKDLWVTSKGHMDEAYLAMVLVGLTTLVTAEMIKPWHNWQDALIRILPMQALGVTSHSSQETLVFTFLLACATILPATLLIMTSAVVKKISGPGGGISIKEISIRFSYMFIPLGLSMHLAHNLSHLLTEGQKVIPAAQRALNKYLSLGLGEPTWDIAPLMGNESVFWLQMGTMIIFNIFSLYAGYRISVKYFPAKAVKVFLPMLALAVAIMIMNVFILGQPMSLRHTH